MSINGRSPFQSLNERSTIVDRSSEERSGSGSNGYTAAKVWANIGYGMLVKDADGVEEERFICLPLGVPVDTQQPKKITNGMSDVTKHQIAAQNLLLEKMQRACASLAPGEAKIFTLEVQLRRVNDPAQTEAPVAAAANPFVMAIEGLD